MHKSAQYKLQNREIRFEVTNLCNARCIMCPREKLTRRQGILDFDLYTRALDEACDLGATVVSLENFGEPFLDPHIIERAKYAKKKGLEVFTISNGSVLDPEIANEAISVFDKIRFSVYGTTKDVYESIHLRLDYNKVISNIDYLIDLKKAKKLQAPKIEVYFLVMDENEHQIEDFKKKWDHRADDISIWKPHNWTDGRTYRAPVDQSKKKTCGRPANGPIQVQWDGIVVPCCFDYNSEIRLGDLNQSSLLDIVTGQEYEKFRKAHLEKQFELYPTCDQCDQLNKVEGVMIYSTNREVQVGTMNTTHDKVD